MLSADDVMATHMPAGRAVFVAKLDSVQHSKAQWEGIPEISVVTF